MTAIIPRLADLTEPSRQLDAAIYLATIGAPETEEAVNDLARFTGGAPTYTRNLAHAKSLVPQDMQWAAGSCGEHDIPWACVTGNDNAATDYAATAATEEIAICIAALMARGIA